MNKIGKAELIKKVNVGLKDLNSEQVRQVIERLLLVFSQSLIKAEDIMIKDYFTLKRKRQSALKTKKEKFCGEHKSIMEAHKKDTTCCGKAGTTKTVGDYSGCKKFRELRNGIKKCENCRTKRKEVEKSRQLLIGVNFQATGQLRKEMIKSAGK